MRPDAAALRHESIHDGAKPPQAWPAEYHIHCQYNYVFNWWTANDAAGHLESSTILLQFQQRKFSHSPFIILWQGIHEINSGSSGRDNHEPHTKWQFRILLFLLFIEKTDLKMNLLLDQLNCRCPALCSISAHSKGAPHICQLLRREGSRHQLSSIFATACPLGNWRERQTEKFTLVPAAFYRLHPPPTVEPCEARRSLAAQDPWTKILFFKERI